MRFVGGTPRDQILADACTKLLELGVDEWVLAGQLFDTGLRIVRAVYNAPKQDVLDNISSLWDAQIIRVTKESDVQEDTENVIPENELAKRRRVHQLADDIVDLCRDAVERIDEYAQMGVPPQDWWPLVLERVKTPRIRSMLDGNGSIATTLALLPVLTRGNAEEMKAALPMMQADLTEQVSGAHPDLMGPIMQGLFGNMMMMPPRMEPAEWNSGMRKLIDRLLAEAPARTSSDGTPQTPAIEAHVTLRSTGMACMGALSKTPEGMLRLLQPNKVDTDERGNGGRDVLVEHFFAYDDVVDIALIREITPTRIIRS